MLASVWSYLVAFMVTAVELGLLELRSGPRAMVRFKVYVQLPTAVTMLICSSVDGSVTTWVVARHCVWSDGDKQRGSDSVPKTITYDTMNLLYFNCNRNFGNFKP